MINQERNEYPAYRNANVRRERDFVMWTVIGGRFVLTFDDADVAPIVFAGDGAEDAALRTFDSKSATLKCHLFAEIALTKPNSHASDRVCNDAALITVHCGKQIRVELLNDDQCVGEALTFDRMTGARSWLTEKGFREDQITVKVEQVCEGASHSPGYQGIFHCAGCQDSCLA
jgi:hypothetical protein